MYHRGDGSHGRFLSRRGGGWAVNSADVRALCRPDPHSPGRPRRPFASEAGDQLLTSSPDRLADLREGAAAAKGLGRGQDAANIPEPMQSPRLPQEPKHSPSSPVLCHQLCLCWGHREGQVDSPCGGFLYTALPLVGTCSVSGRLRPVEKGVSWVILALVWELFGP